MLGFFRNLFVFLFMGVVAVVVYIYSMTRDLPSVDNIMRDGINPTQWTQVFASDGTPIMSFGKFRQQNVHLKEVSPYFIQALIATEDRRFYQHHGVDPVGVVRALLSDLTHKKIREGGSTITQQLARNVFLNNERSMARKIREAALAMKLEDKYSKAQILELYVNNTYFGEGAYGIKAASQVYFGKSPATLTLPEAALLAGLPQAPSGYSPFHNLSGAMTRRNEVLQNLVAVNDISQTECDRDQVEPIRLSATGRNLSAADKAPFFNRYVLEQVMRDYSLDEQSFWQSGLKIYTTLDLHAQMLAENAVRSESALYGRNRVGQQAALLSLNPKTGAILAYVGGKNYQQSQFDRVSTAIRSPGSLFKIFTYTTAIDRGYEPTRVYLDEPFRVGSWQPQNYDRTNHGYMTLAHALITSDNIVAVKLIQELGPDTVAHMAEQMGIRTPMENYLGLTLGGSGVRLIDITSAYGVLANEGVRVEPHGIVKIVDDTGHEIYHERSIKRNVLNRTTVDTMVRMMMGVVQWGTGRAADIGRPVAGKTGTSDDYHDAWFIGFTPDVVTGVWVGNDNNTPMPGMTGGTLPAAIWRDMMSPYMVNRPIQPFVLSYSKPLSDSDFFTYNLKNLSSQEAAGGRSSGAGGDSQQPTDTNTPVTSMDNTTQTNTGNEENASSPVQPDSANNADSQSSGENTPPQTEQPQRYPEPQRSSEPIRPLVPSQPPANPPPLTRRRYNNNAYAGVPVPAGDSTDNNNNNVQQQPMPGYGGH